MDKPYSITVNRVDDEQTFYEGVHWDSSGDIAQDLAFFKRLYPKWTSISVTFVNRSHAKNA